MPYLTDKDRADVDRYSVPTDAGQLTYVIQQALQNFLAYQGTQGGRPNYSDLAACLGAIEGAKLDLIKRVIEPYEKRKRKENGDVWLVGFLRGMRHR